MHSIEECSDKKARIDIGNNTLGLSRLSSSPQMGLQRAKSTQPLSMMILESAIEELKSD